MDTLLPQLLSFPPHPPPATPLADAEYDKQIKALVQNLNQVSTSKLTNGVPGGGDLLDILDPSINTLPYLFTLIAHINKSAGKQATGKKIPLDGPLWSKMMLFIERFDTVQIRYGGSEFRRLLETIAKTAQLSFKPLIAISPIQSAILRLDPSSSCFTSTHLLFVRLCMETRAFTKALPIIDSDIFHFPSISDKGAAYGNSRFLCSQHDSSSAIFAKSSGLSSSLDYKDHLQYFLIGAMIYMGLKNWERALLFLEIVVISPTSNNVSMIQVEAFKKWVLVSLLFKGQAVSMPRTTNPQATKLYRSLTKAYTALAEIFKDGISKEISAQRLLLEIEAGQNLWQEDCNTGLVMQVVDAYRRFSILKLEQTYVALRIAEVAERTSREPNDYVETASYVTSLINSNQLNAHLIESSEDPQNWTLRFALNSTSGPRARTEQQLYEDLVKQTNRTTKLTSYVKEVDRKLGLSKEYIDWCKKSLRNKDATNDLNPTIFTTDEYIADEDMMADL